MRDFNGKIFNALGAVDRNQAAPDFFAPYIRAAIETSDDPEVKRAGEYMLGFNGLYQDRDGDHRYDDPGLTLYRTVSLRVYPDRSEERRVGKECVSTCTSGWWPYPSKKKKKQRI